ncbi:MAG: electron transfer flavoprotein subunit beta/FixA family protein [Thermodesulfobacteriota bacterium]|nr:electron transfer flavoprotein subunit beta/FixA family protein [Thermodesulfobacteriota bacterium]
MKIVVCVKQIPDPSIIEFDLSNESMMNVVWTVNTTDFLALEEGLQVRERFGGEVIVVSLVPEREDDVLKRALIFGADRAIRVWEHSLNDADVWVKSLVLKEVIENIGFDLVLCGDKSKDMGSEFMGAALSERLNVPLITRVVRLEFQGGREAIAHKKLERGKREAYSLCLPAVITLTEGINQLRYVALFSRSYRKGIKKKVEVVTPNVVNRDDVSPLIELMRIGQPKPRTKVGKKIDGLSIDELTKMLQGEGGKNKEIFSGSPLEGARKIENKLKEWLP